MPHKDPARRKAYHRAYVKKWLKTPKGRLAIKRAAKYRKRWGQKNKAALHAIQKRWRTKVKLEALTHYSNGTPCCACCQEQIVAFLTIDHKNGNGAAHRKSLRAQSRIGGTGFYFWLKKHNWPEGFQVLCFNCNLGKRDTGHCPHENIILSR